MPLFVLVLLTLGCSAADLVQRQRETPTAVPTPVLVPTFTPTAVAVQTLVIVTPPSDGTPGVIIVPPGMDPESVLPEFPTATPTPSATPALPPSGEQTGLPPGQPDSPLLPSDGTPIPEQEPPLPVPTDTPQPMHTPTATPTATATPTPFVLVSGGLVALRTGPGIEYPLLAQLGPDIPVAIIGKSEDGGWLQICCVSGETAWVAVQHVLINNDVSTIQVGFAEPPPLPTATPLPTETPSPTPTPTATRYPFERAIGPQFFPTSNAYLTIWAKLFVGTPPTEEPAAGHYLTVKFEGFERPDAGDNAASKDVFEYSAPPGSGNRVQYNYKYEYRPPDPKSLDPNSDATALQLIGTGTWTVYVSDGAGNQLSEEVTFTTAPSNPHREVYIGWVRVR